MTRPCFGGSQDQLNQGQPSIEFVTVQLQQGNNLSGVDRDVLVKFNGAYKFIILVSITAAFRASGVFVHFSPLGYQPQGTGGTNQIAPTGGEHWIALSNSVAGNGLPEGRWIKFARPISQFYIDADHNGVNSATPYLITFAGTNDIEMLIAERQ